MPASLNYPDYRKAGKTLVYELIEQANPGFKDKVGISQFTLGLPTAITPVAPSTSNTSIKLTAASGQTSAIGSKTITYRRIDLNKLFRGRTLVVTKYTIANSLPFADLVVLMRDQLGITIDPTEVVSVPGQTPDSPISFTMKSTCLCYTGSITVTWTKGKREISELLTDGVLGGRVWPQGLIDIQDGSKPQGEMICYDSDASIYATWLNGVTSGSFDNGSWNTTTDTTTLVAWLKSVRPDINWNRGDARVSPGGIGYLYLKRYTIPNAAVPEGNSGLYTKVMVLEPINPAANQTWFFGRILIHYN
jgi:hypothetical protein